MPGEIGLWVLLVALAITYHGDNTDAQYAFAIAAGATALGLAYLYFQRALAAPLHP